MAGSFFGRDADVVSTWTMNADQYKTELRDLEKDIRKHERSTKTLGKVQESLAGHMDKTGGVTSSLKKHFGGLAGTMIKADLASRALSAGLGLIRRQIGAVVDAGLTWNDWIGDNAHALDGMQQATAGIIGKLDLVRARTKLTTGDFHASERQLEALSKAAVLYARIVKVDLRSALDTLADSAITGRDKPLRQLGIDIELLGGKSEKTAKFLDTLADRFGDTAIAATNVNEQVAQMSAAFDDALGSMGDSILRARPVRWFIDGLTNAMRSLSETSEQMADRVGAAEAAAIAKRQGITDPQKIKALTDRMKQVSRLTQQYGPGIDFVFKEPGLHGDTGGDDAAMRRLIMYGAQVKQRPVGKKKAATREGRPFDPLAALPALPVSDVATYGPGELIGGAMAGGLGGALGGGAALGGMGELMKSAGFFDTSGLDALAKALTPPYNHAKKLREQMDATAIAVEDASLTMKSAGLGALADFGAGVWAAADAAIQGGQGFGLAMIQMAKQALLGIAAQATAKALFAMGEGFLFPATAAKSFAAAKFYWAAAAAAGAGGLALSAATAGGGGGGPGGGVGAGGGGSGGSLGTPTTPRPAQEREREQLTIVVEAYLGDEGDRGAQLQDKRRAKFRARQL